MSSLTSDQGSTTSTQHQENAEQHYREIPSDQLTFDHIQKLHDNADQNNHSNGIPSDQTSQADINLILSSLPVSNAQVKQPSSSDLAEITKDSIPDLNQPHSLQLVPTPSVIVSGSNANSTTSSDPQQIQAYAMLDFDSFTFYVQTMQILLGRMIEGDTITDSLDIHLGSQKAISRRHAKIFYNFGNQRFELSVMGRNGAFVDDLYIERGVTVPLGDGTRIQIGETGFVFVLPKSDNKINDPLEHIDQLKKDLSILNEEKDTKKKSFKKKELIDDQQYVSSIMKTPYDPSTQSVPKLDSDLVNELRANAEASVVKKEEAAKAAAAAAASISGSNTQLMTSTDNNTVVNSPVLLPLKQESPVSSKKSRPKTKRQPKAAKKIYQLDEIPEQYRDKPALPYSTLIADCLRQRGTERGMSLSEIYKGIQELYPYYFYCPDGWQSSVRHNLSLNKSFKKISKEGKGWLWGLNEEVVAEKDKLKQKQLEAAKLKAKIAPPIQKPIMHSTLSNNIPPAASSPNNSKLSGDTKKALSYLQQELISLTKNRKMYDKDTTTQILTQALAMTISQVNKAAKNAGIKGSPLVTLIDKNPSHITKILTAALNAATLQIAKKKGLPVYLPQKASTIDTSAAPAPPKPEPPTIKSPTGPIMLKPGQTAVAKKELPSNPHQHSVLTQSHPIPMKAFPVTNIVPKPMVHQFSKPPAQFSKPAIKSISGSSVQSLTPGGISSIQSNSNHNPNSSNLNSNCNSSSHDIKNISKPQYYAKNCSVPLSGARSVVGLGRPVPFSGVKKIKDEKDRDPNLGKVKVGKEKEEEELKRSIEKFGQPPQPVTSKLEKTASHIESKTNKKIEEEFNDTELHIMLENLEKEHNTKEEETKQTDKEDKKIEPGSRPILKSEPNLESEPKHETKSKEKQVDETKEFDHINDIDLFISENTSALKEINAVGEVEIDSNKKRNINELYGELDGLNDLEKDLKIPKQ